MEDQTARRAPFVRPPVVCGGYNGSSASEASPHQMLRSTHFPCLSTSEHRLRGAGGPRLLAGERARARFRGSGG